MGAGASQRAPGGGPWSPAAAREILRHDRPLSVLSDLYAVSGAHGEAPRGFLSFAPPSPTPVEDVVCVEVRGDEAAVGLRSGETGRRLLGLRAGINPVRMAVSRDPTTCAAVQADDLPASSVEANTQIHDAP